MHPYFREILAPGSGPAIARDQQSSLICVVAHAKFAFGHAPASELAGYPDAHWRGPSAVLGFIFRHRVVLLVPPSSFYVPHATSDWLYFELLDRLVSFPMLQLASWVP